MSERQKLIASPSELVLDFAGERTRGRHGQDSVDASLQGAPLGGGMVDARAFGDDEAGAAGCPARVIAHDSIRRNSTRRAVSRHRCHRHAIAKFPRTEREGAVQLSYGVGRCFRHEIRWSLQWIHREPY